jgi:hypothetical protein
MDIQEMGRNIRLRFLANNTLIHKNLGDNIRTNLTPDHLQVGVFWSVSPSAKMNFGNTTCFTKHLSHTLAYRPSSAEFAASVALEGEWVAAITWLPARSWWGRHLSSRLSRLSFHYRSIYACVAQPSWLGGRWRASQRSGLKADGV